jgi:hypothetical protein
MLEMIRRNLMQRYQAKMEGIQKLTEKITPNIAKKLEALVYESMDYVALYVGDDTFEVSGPTGKQFVVDMRRRTCGCRVWQMTEIPCVHACAVI